MDRNPTTWTPNIGANTGLFEKIATKIPMIP